MKFKESVIDMKKFWFYFLTFTWGLPMTIIGFIARLVVGKQPIRKFGYCKVYQFGKGWGGVSLGTTIITSTPFDDKLMAHEHGHAIQNCWFGFLFPFVVGLPSMIRYWWREWMWSLGRRDLPDYYSIWFEGQASKLGTALITKLNNNK